MKRFGLLCLALVLALGSLGVGYAAWTDTIYINGTVSTGSVEFCIDDNSWGQKDHGPDWTCDSVCSPVPDVTLIRQTPEGKDVGSTDISLTGCDTLVVTVNNAYPCYYEHITFKGRNMGSVPIKIWKAVISDGVNDYPFYAPTSAKCLEFGQGAETGPDMLVWWGDGWGVQLEENETYDFSFEFHILQPMPQRAGMGGDGDPDAFTFTITIYVIQWDEYAPSG